MSALLIKIAIVTVVAGGLAGGGYYKGRMDGRAAVLRDSIKAWESRAEVEDEIASDDPVALCRRLGGMPDECDELRGLAQDSR